MDFGDQHRALLRALHTYTSRMADDARTFRMPSLDKSSVARVNGLDYVRVVDSAGSLCAVYRITPRQLNRLKRWPAELNSPAPTAL